MTNKIANNASSTVSQVSLLTRAAQLAMLLFVLLMAVIVAAVILFLARSKPDPILPDESVTTLTVYQGYSALADGPSTISERPLFWQGRRPLSNEQEIKDLPPPVEKNRNIDEFELIGLLNAGTDSSAIVMYEKQKYRLHLDDELAGWRLVAVFNNAVIFEESSASTGEGAETIKLYDSISLPRQWPDGNSLLNNTSDF